MEEITPSQSGGALVLSLAPSLAPSLPHSLTHSLTHRERLLNGGDVWRPNLIITPKTCINRAMERSEVKTRACGFKQWRTSIQNVCCS